MVSQFVLSAFFPPFWILRSTHNPFSLDFVLLESLKDIPENVVAYGMPAKVTKKKIFLYLKIHS